MGRKRKRTHPQLLKQQQHDQQQPRSSKKQKQGRAKQYRRRSSGRAAVLYWIQDCPDLWPSDRDDDDDSGEPGVATVVNPPPELLIWITASHLADAHAASSSSSSTALDPSRQHQQRPQNQPTTNDPAVVSSSLQVVGDEESQPAVTGSDCGQSNDCAETATLEDSKKEDPVPLVTGLDSVGWPSRGAYRAAAEFPTNVLCSEAVSSKAMETKKTDSDRTISVKPTTAFEDRTAKEERDDEQENEQPPSASALPIIYCLRDRQSLPICDRSDATQEQKQQQQQKRHRPHGDCGDGIRNPYSNDIVQDKYWAQRKRLFTRFDDGIQLDADGWFSVTPEAIAQHIARRMTANSDLNNNNNHNFVVLDAFCGVGGNTIALAQQPSVALVVAVDTNLERIRLAAHNCRVYHIPRHKVLFVHGNACHVLSQYRDGKQLLSLEADTAEEADDDDELEGDGARVEKKVTEPNAPANNEDQVKTSGVAESNSSASVNAISSNENSNNSTDETWYKVISGTTPRQMGQLRYHNLDAIFLSPPWGGTDYEQIGPRHYTLDQGIQLPQDDTDNTVVVDGVDLLRQSLSALPPDRLNLAYFLPRNLNGLTLAQQAYECGARGCLELEQNILNGKLKTITAYLQNSTPGETTVIPRNGIPNES